jgi:predicted MFS family arabinose efflux permease
VKPTVLVGLVVVGVCTVLFGVGSQSWEIEVARFFQGFASSFTWTGALAWLVAAAPANRRGTLIGAAFATAVGGELLGPVLGGVAGLAGIGWTFGVVGVASFGLVAWAAATPAAPPGGPQSLRVLAGALRNPQMLGAYWFVLLPALLFGVLSVLAPLRLSALGFGSVAIGAVFLCAAAFEVVNNVVVGRVSDRRGPLYPIGISLAVSIVVAAVLPWPNERFALAALVVCASLSFGTFFTPGLTLLTNLSEARGLDYGYTFALVNLAWAPGQTLGAAGGGGLAHVTGDAAPYLVLSALCAVTLVGLRRSG